MLRKLYLVPGEKYPAVTKYSPTPEAPTESISPPPQPPQKKKKKKKKTKKEKRVRYQTHDADAGERGFLTKSLTQTAVPYSSGRESFAVTASATSDPTFRYRNPDDARKKLPLPSTLEETFASSTTMITMIMLSSRKMRGPSVERM